MANPLVSVCIPTYCGATFLADAIDSVFNQTYPHFEIWVIDDNSPDDTKAIVSKYTDKRIKYIRNENNLGPQGNWNRCLELAQGKYCKLLPHDDLLAIDCLEKQVAVLENDKACEIALVFGSRQIINPDGKVLMTRGLPHTKAGRINGIAMVRRTIRAGANQIGEPGNGLFRRDIIQKVGMYDASYPYLIDLDYWVRVLIHGDAYYTETPTSSFRISSGSWSVAIGHKQYQDFKGFINKFRKLKKLRISRTDVIIGLINARIKTIVRILIYRYIFRKENYHK
jgi:glycosyltransferase involved in cell wall biosynthesis